MIDLSLVPSFVMVPISMFVFLGFGVFLMTRLQDNFFPKDLAYASNTVTAVNHPPGVDGARLLKVLREKHGVVLSGGQASLVGKIFRIGHLGLVDVADMDQVIDALAQALPEAR